MRPDFKMPLLRTMTQQGGLKVPKTVCPSPSLRPRAELWICIHGLGALSNGPKGAYAYLKNRTEAQRKEWFSCYQEDLKQMLLFVDVPWTEENKFQVHFKNLILRKLINKFPWA